MTPCLYTTFGKARENHFKDKGERVVKLRITIEEA